MRTVYFLRNADATGILSVKYEFLPLESTPAITYDGKPYPELWSFYTLEAAQSFCASLPKRLPAAPLEVNLY